MPASVAVNNQSLPFMPPDAFLNFKNLQEASSRVMLAVNDAHRAEGAVFLPPQGLLAVASSAPVNVSVQPYIIIPKDTVRTSSPLL